MCNFGIGALYLCLLLMLFGWLIVNLCLDFGYVCCRFIWCLLSGCVVYGYCLTSCLIVCIGCTAAVVLFVLRFACCDFAS